MVGNLPPVFFHERLVKRMCFMMFSVRVWGDQELAEKNRLEDFAARVAGDPLLGRCCSHFLHVAKGVALIRIDVAP